MQLRRLNLPLLIAELEKWSKQFIAGSPVHAILLIGGQMGQVTVKDSSAPLTGSVTFLDAKGAATTADDVPVWTSSDEAVATAVAADDGLSATISIGTPGVTVISVDSTDADGTTVHSEGTITVQSGEAVIGDVEFATP